MKARLSDTASGVLLHSRQSRGAPSDDGIGELDELDLLEHPNAARGCPTEVRFLPYVFKLDNIDPLAMTCFVHVEVALRWRDDRVVERRPDADGAGAGGGGGGAGAEPFYRVKPGLLEDDEDAEDPGWAKVWRPNLVLDQVVGEEDEAGELNEMACCRDPASGAPMLYMYRIYRNTVRVGMDLRRFPFDRQCVAFNFMLQDQPSTEATLQLHSLNLLTDASACLDERVDGATDGYELVGCRLVPDVCPEEWSEVMARHGLLTERERRAWSATGGAAQFANMELRFDARREPFFFLSKTVMVVYVLLLMELATVTVMAEDDIGTRSSVSLTLFLTAVAFQFATSGDLPKLPYLTYLDKLMAFMYLMLFAAYVENAVVFKMAAGPDGDAEAAAEVDSAFAIGYFACVGVSAVVLGVRGARASYSVPEAFQALYHDTLATVDQEELGRLDAAALAELRERVPEAPPPADDAPPHRLPSISPLLGGGGEPAAERPACAEQGVVAYRLAL